MEISTAALDDLHAHYTGGCPGCTRCDLYPAVMEGDANARASYVLHMREAHGVDITAQDEDLPPVEPTEPETGCLRCGSDRIIRNTKVQDLGNNNMSDTLKLHLGAQHPNALMFTGELKTELRAEVCCGCGYVAFRVADPEGLWEQFHALPEQKRP